MKSQENLRALCNIAKECTSIDVRFAKGRKAEYVRIKAAIANIAIRHLGIQSIEVGEFFDYRDHTTISHHKKNHEGRYKTDPEYSHLYSNLFSKSIITASSPLDVEEVCSLLRG